MKTPDHIDFSPVDCGACGKTITFHANAVRNRKALASLKAISGQDITVGCRECATGAIRVANGGHESALGTLISVIKRGPDTNYFGMGEAIMCAEKAVSKCETQIRKAFAEIKSSTERMNFLNHYLREGRAAYAQWLFNSYDERRKRANYVISRLEIRLMVFHRDGNKCVKCGSRKYLQIDHIIAVRNGGDDDLKNFQTLCGKCNASKGARQ